MEAAYIGVAASVDHDDGPGSPLPRNFGAAGKQPTGGLGDHRRQMPGATTRALMVEQVADVSAGAPSERK